MGMANTIFGAGPLVAGAALVVAAVAGGGVGATGGEAEAGGWSARSQQLPKASIERVKLKFFVVVLIKRILGQKYGRFRSKCKADFCKFFVSFSGFVLSWRCAVRIPLCSRATQAG